MDEANKAIEEEVKMIKDTEPGPKEPTEEETKNKDPFAAEVCHIIYRQKSNKPLMKEVKVDVIIFNKDTTLDQTKQFTPYKATVSNTEFILTDMNNDDQRYNLVNLMGQGLGKGIFMEPLDNYEKLARMFRTKIAKRGREDPFE